MTWTNLKTNYKNIDWDGLRKYQMIDNQDGTVSFLDVTEYINAEDANVLANGLNQNNDAVNRIMNGEYFYFEGEVDTLLGAKQNLLTFDNAPTSGSANPVKSGGIKTALDTISSRIDNLTVFSIYVCGNGEYNPTTGQPTIQNPDTSTFYLVPSSGSAPDIFTEWIYVNNAWELFGSGKVDLSNYVTQSDLQTALAGKEDTLTFDSSATSGSFNPVTSDGIYNGLSGKSNIGHDHDDRYYTETETDTLLAGKSSTGHEHDNRYYTESEMDTLLGGKRDVSDSYTKNEVDTLLSAKVDNTSLGGMAFVGDASSDGQAYGRKDGGWYDLDGRYYTESETDTLLGGKQDTLTFDNAPTSGSANPVKSGGIYTALGDKADTSSLGGMAFVGDSSSDGKAYARKDGEWYDLDGRYYTESEVDTALADKVDKAGDNMTGTLIFKSQMAGYADPDSATAKYYNSILLRDKNNQTTTYFQQRDESTGHGFQLGVMRTVNGTTYCNALALRIKADGSLDIGFTDTSVWREKLNVVDKAGDTMMGNLTISKATPYLNLKHTGMDNSAQSLSSELYNAVVYRDKNDNTMGFTRITQATNGTTQLVLLARHTYNGANVNNYIMLNVDKSGNGTVNLSHPEAWRNALGLGDSGWQAITDTRTTPLFSGTIYYRKIGKQVYLESTDLKLASNLAAASYRDLGAIIPSGYRPDKTAFGLVTTSNTTIDKVMYVIVSASGDFGFHTNPNGAVTTSMTLRLSMTYPTA